MSGSSAGRAGLSWPLDWDRVPYFPASGPFPEIPPVLPEDDLPSSCSPSTGIDLRTGRAAASAERIGRGFPLDSREWVSGDGHELGLVRLGDQLVAVDRDLQPLIQALNDAGIRTLTSCRDGFLMFIEDDWRRFCGFWEANQDAIGVPTIGRSIAHSRDAEWAEWIRSHYPPHFPIHLDQNGLTTTVFWLFELDELLPVMPRLVSQLARC